MTVSAKALPRLEWFKGEMLKELEKPENGGRAEDWREASLYFLLERLNVHVDRLQTSLFSNSMANITKDCVDVANYALMIADVNKSRY